MTWIVLGIVVLHTVGIGWGLPASDGWDNDGVAPRDFLPGLAETFTPGHYYTYPPVHLALLAVLTLPVTVVGALRAPSHALGDIVHELLAPGYMTSIAYIARFVSMSMSVGIVLLAARIVEEVRAFELGEGAAAARRGWAARVVRAVEGDFSDPRIKRVGCCTAVFVGLSASLTYYAHTTNLDVPYLFWAMASVLAFVRALARDDGKRFRHAFVYAVLAIGTKDQAYALFGLSFPIALLLARPRWKDVAIAAGLAAALLLFTDAIVLNPTGFRARLGFLTGSASQDFVEYTRDWSGRFRLLGDAVTKFDAQYPKLVAPLFAFGLYRALSGARGKRLAIAALPLLVALSFTVLFNWAALRTNARFLMPQALMLGLYGGVGAEALLFSERRALRFVSYGVLGLVALLALRTSVSVDANFVHDPRYDAEAWMREHVRPGDTIETYGLNVYLPRFPEGVRVIRVGPEPADKRNPLPGVTEVQASFEDADTRDARFVVLSEAWAWRYLISANPELRPGEAQAPTQHRSASDDAASEYFHRLLWSQDEFGFAHGSDYEPTKWFPIVDVHGAVGRSIWIYERGRGRAERRRR